MALDLTHPVSVDEWIFLELARAGLEGDLRFVDATIAKVETELQLA